MTGIEVIGELTLLGMVFVFYLIAFFFIWMVLHLIEKGVRRELRKIIERIRRRRQGG